MPTGGPDVLRAIHVLSAAVVLGALVTLPFLRRRLQGAEDVRFARDGLATIADVERWLLTPGTVLLLVAGLLLVEGPWARFSFTAPGAGWLHIGTTLWLVLFASVGWMVHSRRTLQELAEEGASGGREVRKWWGRWMAGATLAALGTAGAVVVMTMKLGA